MNGGEKELKGSKRKGWVLEDVYVWRLSRLLEKLVHSMIGEKCGWERHLGVYE